MSDGGVHLDSALVEAVSTSCQDLQQPEAVANRLLAWIEQMSMTELSTVDHERFLQNVLEALLVEEDPHAN